MSTLLDPIKNVIGWLLSLFYLLPPHNLGIAIILMTVVVMAAMLPLTAKQVRSMIAMQRLAPEIKRIQQENKDDRQKQNEAVMKFYQENQINPIAGCLPLVLQLPVWFALFGTLRAIPKYVVHPPSKLDRLYNDLCFHKATQSLLAVKQCSSSKENPLHFLGLDLRWSLFFAKGEHVSFMGLLPYGILVGLVVVSGIVQMRQTMSRQKAQNPSQPVNQQQQTMMKVMPLLNLMTIGFPSGVALYWLTRNVWTIGQQHFVLAKYYEDGANKAAPKAAAPPTPTPPEIEAPAVRPNPNTSKKKQQRRKR